VFDWSDLRYFLAVARTSSMGAAARSLRLDQSTVRRRLSTLEAALGHQLVEKHPGGYRLTRNGEQLLAHAEPVEAAAHAFARATAALDVEVLGHIRVASLVTVGHRILRSGFLDRFRTLHPGISVEMLLGQDVADLSRGEADVAIRGGGAGSGVLVGRKIAELPWAIYANRTFVERHGRPATAQDLSGFPTIEFIGGLEKLPAASWMKRHGAGTRIVARCDNIPSAQLAVRSGAGIAPLPAAHAGSDPELVDLFGPVRELDYPIYLLTHRDLRRTRPVGAFIDFCVRELKPVLSTGTLRS
jgi:DNA-binding transcriptional LysR family regulator